MVKAKIDLKIRRIRRGLFQKEIAKAVGLTGSSFSQIEQGKKPTTGKTANKIADFLGVSFDDLFEMIEKGA